MIKMIYHRDEVIQAADDLHESLGKLLQLLACIDEAEAKSVLSSRIKFIQDKLEIINDELFEQDGNEIITFHL